MLLETQNKLCNVIINFQREFLYCTRWDCTYMVNT